MTPPSHDHQEPIAPSEALATSRRDAIAALSGLAALLAGTGSRAADAPSPAPPASSAPAGERLTIVMLAHPDMTALDLVAPQLVFATLGNVDVQIAWKDEQPVVTDSGLAIVPNTRFDRASAAPDLLFVPGGLKGTTAMIRDAQVLDFVKSRGAAARWVTSVCTGSLLLGAAGLLRGKRATSHWYVRDLLPLVQAKPVNERVVRDGHLITGAGVTSGMDFALTVSAALRGEAHAKRQQLVFEYAPQPPFEGGTPERSGPELTNAILQTRRPAIDAARAALTSLQASS